MNPVSADVRRIDARLRKLLGDERNTQVDFVLGLDEFDRAEGYEAFECASLWQYLRRELGMVESACWRRTQAMKLLRRFPQVEPWLRDGRVWMCALVKLGEVLTEENFCEMLSKAAGKSYREIEVLVASFKAPLPDRKPVVRLVPEPKQEDSNHVANRLGSADAVAGAGSPTAGGTAGEFAGHSEPVAVEPGGSMGTTDSLFSSGNAATVIPRKPRIEPVSARQYDISLRVDAEFVEAMNALKKLYSHDIPNGDPARVLLKAMRTEIARHERRARQKMARESGTKTVRKNDRKSAPGDAGSAPRREPIRAAVEREVRGRDGDRCQWPMPDGRICASEHQVEMEHRISVAKGGKSNVENLWQVCRAHNQLKARRELGRKHMAKFRKKVDRTGAPEAKSMPVGSARDAVRGDFSREKCDSPSFGVEELRDEAPPPA